MQNYRVKRSISTLTEEYVYEVVRAMYDKDRNIIGAEMYWPIGCDIPDVERQHNDMAKAFNRPVIELIDGEYLEVE